jgi:hypothetical protein
MEKNSVTCPWGDCPDLDHGPKSTEHEGRFLKPGKVSGQMVKSDSTAMISGNNTQNLTK